MIEDVPLSASRASTILHVHDVGVPATPTRRRFTVAYTRKILDAVAGGTPPGDRSAWLRRDGLYSSHLTAWRSAQRRGELAGPARRRGPVPAPPDVVLQAHRDAGTATGQGDGTRGARRRPRGGSKKLSALWDQMRPLRNDTPTGRR